MLKGSITNSEQLRNRIQDLENKKRNQELGIKANYEQVKTNLKPVNLMKNTFSYVAEVPEIKKVLINTAIGFLLGYASKKAADLLSEENLNKTLEKFAHHHLDKWENKSPGNFISQAISMVRKFTPQDSPLYPFVKYNRE